MDENLEVSVESLHDLQHLSIIVLKLRFLDLHPRPDKIASLQETEVCLFFSKIEPVLQKVVQDSVNKTTSGIKVTVSCAEARLGSFEFFVVITCCPILTTAAVSTGTAAAIYKIIKDYKTLKEGLTQLVKDIRAVAAGLKATAIEVWDWLKPQDSTTVQPGQGEKVQSPADIKQEPEERQNKVFQARITKLDERASQSKRPWTQNQDRHKPESPK